MKRIYIANKVTGMPNENRRWFKETAEKFREAGWNVISPLEIVPPLPSALHGSAMYKHAMKIDLLAVHNMADAIALGPDWLSSQGACFEVLTAIFFGLEIYNAETMQRVSLKAQYSFEHSQDDAEVPQGLGLPSNSDFQSRTHFDSRSVESCLDADSKPVLYLHPEEESWTFDVDKTRKFTLNAAVDEMFRLKMEDDELNLEIVPLERVKQFLKREKPQEHYAATWSEIKARIDKFTNGIAEGFKSELTDSFKSGIGSGALPDSAANVVAGYVPTDTKFAEALETPCQHEYTVSEMHKGRKSTSRYPGKTNGYMVSNEHCLAWREVAHCGMIKRLLKFMGQGERTPEGLVYQFGNTHEIDLQQSVGDFLDAIDKTLTTIADEIIGAFDGLAAEHSYVRVDPQNDDDDSEFGFVVRGIRFTIHPPKTPQSVDEFDSMVRIQWDARFEAGQAPKPIEHQQLWMTEKGLADGTLKPADLTPYPSAIALPVSTGNNVIMAQAAKPQVRLEHIKRTASGDFEGTGKPVPFEQLFGSEAR